MAFWRGLQLNPKNQALRSMFVKADREIQENQEGVDPEFAVFYEEVTGEPVPAGAQLQLSGSLSPGRTATANGTTEAELEALGSSTAAAVMEPSSLELAEAQKALGNEAYKAGRWTEAVACYSSAISLEPNCAAFYSNRSAAELMRKNFKAAFQDALHATKLDPSFVRGLTRAAKALVLMGHFGRAEELYRQALQLNPSVHQELITAQIIASKVAAAETALNTGAPQLALTMAEAAYRAAAPPAEPAVRLRVEALLACGRHAEAVAEARALTRDGDASAPEVLELRARAIYLCGNVDVAQQLLTQVDG